MNKPFTPRNLRGESNYRLVREIARGGMGAIYEGVQLGAEGFAKTMAIKTILPRYSENREFVNMFIGEAKLVANLVHENIVQIYQLGKDEEGNYYIAMEYMDGINLEDFIVKHLRLGRDVPVEIACFIAARVCRGLEYAHSKCDADGVPMGIVHRDISPKNILINTEGTVRITDFGVAKARHFMQQNEEEVLMGKLEYMSPEQADYQITDARSDLFSLGTVFYELLTGDNMFYDPDADETLDRVKKLAIPDPRTRRSSIPEDVVHIVMKALDRDPARRYQSAGEMGYALEYHMYHDRYGPTVQALAQYLSTLWPDRAFGASSRPRSMPVMVDTHVETVVQPAPDSAVRSS